MGPSFGAPRGVEGRLWRLWPAGCWRCEWQSGAVRHVVDSHHSVVTVASKWTVQSRAQLAIVGNSPKFVTELAKT